MENEHEVRSGRMGDDGIQYRPVGIFWNLNTCPIPNGKSASDVISHLRRYFTQYRNCHKEFEFLIACDVTKLENEVCDDINKTEGVILAHVRLKSKKASSSDKTLLQSIKKFIDVHKSEMLQPIVVFISGETLSAPVLRGYLLEKKCFVILIHPTDCSLKLTIGWSEHYPLEELCAAVPTMLDNVQDEPAEVSDPAEQPKKKKRSTKEKNGSTDDGKKKKKKRSATEAEANEVLIDHTARAEGAEAESETFEVPSGSCSGHVENADTSTVTVGAGSAGLEHSRWIHFCAFPGCHAPGRETKKYEFNHYSPCLQHIRDKHWKGVFGRNDWTPITFVKKYWNLEPKRFYCAYPTCFEERTLQERPAGNPITGFYMSKYGKEAHFYHFHNLHRPNCSFSPSEFLFVSPLPSSSS